MQILSRPGAHNTHLSRALRGLLLNLLLHLRAPPQLLLNAQLGLLRRARLLLDNGLGLPQLLHGLVDHALSLQLHLLQPLLQQPLALLRRLRLALGDGGPLPLHLLLEPRPAGRVSSRNAKEYGRWDNTDINSHPLTGRKNKKTLTISDSTRKQGGAPLLLQALVQLLGAQPLGLGLLGLQLDLRRLLHLQRLHLLVARPHACLQLRHLAGQVRLLLFSQLKQLEVLVVLGRVLEDLQRPARVARVTLLARRLVVRQLVAADGGLVGRLQ